MELGRYGDAAVSLRRAAQLRPNHTEAQRHLGVACAVVEDAPCAVAALKALADDQLLPSKRVAEEIKRYKIDPEGPNPARS